MANAQVTGFASAALLYGYQSRIQPLERKLGTFKDYITFEEQHSDELEITDSPIEQGAAITDHAFKRPAELTIKIGWSNSPGAGAGVLGGLLGGFRGLVNTIKIIDSTLQGQNKNQVREVYAKLLDMQAKREVIEVFTGKRQYPNMLIKSLHVVTDKNSDNILSVTVGLRQIIRVTTQVVNIARVPAANQQNPQSTQAPVVSGNKQLVPTANVDTDMFGRVLNPRDRR